MKKIPVQIIKSTSPSGKKAIDVMIDIYDYNEIEKGQEKIYQFKKKYSEMVKKAEKLFFGSNLDKTKKSKNLLSSTCWKLGNLFLKFKDDVKNDFTVTNYAKALERDFGRSRQYVRELITFSRLFKKKEILDIIPMATYRVLIWKKNQLEEAGILEKEKNRLTEMGNNQNAPGREEYKIQLINAIQNEKLKTKSSVK